MARDWFCRSWSAFFWARCRALKSAKLTGAAFLVSTEVHHEASISLTIAEEWNIDDGECV